MEVEKGAIDTDFTGRPRSTDYMIVDHVWVHKGAHKSIDPAASGPPELVINDEAISVEAINRIIGPLKRTSIDNATHSDVSIDSRTLDVIEKLVIGEQHTNGRHSWRISSSRSHHSESAEIGSVSPIETHFIIPSADVNFCISRVVVQDYDPQKEDELSLRRGDSLTILKSFVDGWFWARNDNGQEGMIPGNFLE